jgi:ribosome-associated protein
MEKVQIHSEFITLTQLLKIKGFIGTGGEAKHFLQSAVVTVNDEPEQRRGRKLYPGNRVVIDGQAFLIVSE